MFAAQKDYSNEALEPFLSSEALSFHYGKHHVGYANNLNSLIKGTEFEKLSLEEIIIKSRGKNQKIFNNASQLFNHDFYWKCLSKQQEGFWGEFETLVINQFGSFHEFMEEYISFAGAMFGSGWSWLVLNSAIATELRLEFINTSNAENPIGSNDVIPLCVLDLWEHAYYIDYRNDRADYIRKIVENCINWEFCNLQLENI